MRLAVDDGVGAVIGTVNLNRRLEKLEADLESRVVVENPPMTDERLERLQRVFGRDPDFYRRFRDEYLRSKEGTGKTSEA